MENNAFKGAVVTVGTELHLRNLASLNVKL